MHNFKKACLATLSLLLTMILVFCVYTAPYFGGTAYYYQDAKMRDSLAGQLDLLVIGSSHAFRSIDPEVLDAELGCNSYNLACAMQTMRGRYYLLKHEIARNPVKTVILEVSYNALTRDRVTEGPEGDIYELARFSNPLDRISYFFSTIYPSEYTKLFYDTMDRSSTAWEKLLKGEMKPYSGRGFLGLDAEDMTVTRAEGEAMYHSSPTMTELNADDVAYFEKCLTLCKEKGVRLILVVTPLSDKQIICNTDLETVRGWYLHYAEKYGCEFYDFNLIKTKLTDYPSDTAFFDSTHLSREGAAVFSAQLCDVLHMVDAGEDISGLFLVDYATITQMTMASLSE